MEAGYSRAEILIGQKRFAQAEPELRAILAREPGDGRALMLLAICLSGQEKNTEAIETARQAVALSPDDPECHVLLGNLLVEAEDFKGAQEQAEAALRIAPDWSASAHDLRTRLHLRRREWQQALESAERGLRIEPQDVGCINLRAIALKQLGRADEAAGAIDEALAQDPEDAHSIANKGWNLIGQRRFDEAALHFREALKIDPGLEWAQAGIAEVLRVRNPFYRVLFGYSQWMSKLSGRAVWGVIIGGYVLFRLLRGMARTNPEFAPYITPLLILYLLFVLYSWLGAPLTNLMLRLHPLGRYALSRNEIRGANWAGGMLAGAIVAGAIAYLIGSITLGFAALVGGMMSIPASIAAGCESPRGARKLVGYAIVLGLAGVGLVAGLALGHDRLLALCGAVFGLGFLAFSFYANKVTLDSGA